MKLDKDKIRESLTESDIKLILRDLGSAEPKKTNGKKELHFQTVCHGGHKHKLYYYPDSKSFRCYTDCQESFDIYELVMKSKKITFPEALKYVASLTGKYFSLGSTLSKAESYLIDDWNWIDRYKKKEKIKVDLPVYDERVLDVFLPYPHEDWLNEGISYEVMQEFEIGYYQREDKITIPHRSAEGLLVGIRGRALRQEDIDAGKKYMPLTIENRLYNHPTMFNLYGLHKNVHTIQRLRKAIIYEGEKSVLKCNSIYGKNSFAVAISGSNISDWHAKTLINLGIEEVFLALDRQYKEQESEEAYKYAEKLIKYARKFSPYVRTYVLWDEENLLDYRDSPIDKGKEVLEVLMKQKYEIKTKESE